MADTLNDDYRERGVIPIHVMLEDCPPTTETCTFDDNDILDWKDAHEWAYESDFDGDTVDDPFQTKFPVLADVDRSLWTRFSPGCSGCRPLTLDELLCSGTCQVTTQTQVLDRGLLTVDDTCHHEPPSGGPPLTCTPCVGGGYDDGHIRSVLDSIVPVKWCGEAIE